MTNNKDKAIFYKPELSVEELSQALYKANQRLLETNNQLEESERMRLELFANLSHDLRSPISTIRSYVEYLLSFDTLDKEEVISTLSQIHTKLLTLDDLMSDLLFMTTLDSCPKEALSLESVQIGQYLEEFFYSCKEDKKYLDRNLILKIPLSFEYYVNMDTKMFRRVMDNLFTNAQKYSHPGDSILLDASCNGKIVIITVTDTGIGIDEKHIKRIFERTYMVSDARTPDKINRCGLGLSIASSIISKHSGEIWCESILGKGSTFYISLPCVIHVK